MWTILVLAAALAGPVQEPDDDLLVRQVVLGAVDGPGTMLEELRGIAAGMSDSEGRSLVLEFRYQSPLRDLSPTLGLPLAALATAGPIDAGVAPEGDLPEDVAITPDGTLAVISNRHTDNLTFLDLLSGAIVDTVAVGAFPEDVELTPDGTLALTADTFSDTMSVVRMSDRTLVAQVDVGVQPTSIRVSADSKSAYVGNLVDQTMSRVDLSTLTVTGLATGIPLGVIGGSWTPETGNGTNAITDFELALGDTRAVVEDPFNDGVVFVDLATMTVVGSLSWVTSIGDVAITPDGLTAGLITNALSPTPGYHRVDVASMTEIGSLTTLPSMTWGWQSAVTKNGLWGLGQGLNEVFAVDMASGAHAATLTTGTVGGIVSDASGQWILVANSSPRVFDAVTLLPAASLSTGDGMIWSVSASPATPDAVGLNMMTEEWAARLLVQGAASTLLGTTPSGEGIEGDTTRTVAMDPAGTVAAVANNVSDNLTLVDLLADAVIGHVDLLGDRIGDIEITPDGRWAVVSSMETDELKIVDLENATLAASVPVKKRPDQLVITPDGGKALVATLANGASDHVSIVTLAGASSSHLADVQVGQLGAVYAGWVASSSLALTPDGSTCIVANSFDDDVDVIDVASAQVVASVPVGDFPVNVAVRPDGAECAVSAAFGDTITFIDLAAPGGPQVSATLADPAIQYPLDMVYSADGEHLYVGCYSGNSIASVRVSDHQLAGSHATGAGRVWDLALGQGDRLHASLVGTAEVVVLDAQGPVLGLVETIAMETDPGWIAASTERAAAVVTEPVLDHIRVLHEPWTLAYGTGWPGAAGTPLLGTSAPPALGSTFSFTVANGAASAPAGVLVALDRVEIPLFGGGTLLVAPPFALTFQFGLDAAGAGAAQVTVPANPGLAGQLVDTQAWVLDFTAPGSFALSSGMELGLWN